jgi:hypothetical protein
MPAPGIAQADEGAFMPFPPIRLTDAELDAVMSAARPLAVAMRDPFLRAVATALDGSKVIGPGVVARTCAELQRQFFDPPEVSHTSTRFRSGRP